MALDATESVGAAALHFDGVHLSSLPLYSPADPDRSPETLELIEAVRRADGLIVASPGYHASLSGMVKNALDYLEDLRDDGRPYLSGRGVGCIATGAGWQATVATLNTLRAIVHALRGWPTPLGAAINTAGALAGDEEARARFQLETIGAEVVGFARMQRQGLARGATVGA
jgi:FMN reductase